MGSKFIGAGLATIALAGAGVGIGSVFSSLILVISSKVILGFLSCLFVLSFGFINLLLNVKYYLHMGFLGVAGSKTDLPPVYDSDRASALGWLTGAIDRADRRFWECPYFPRYFFWSHRKAGLSLNEVSLINFKEISVNAAGGLVKLNINSRRWNMTQIAKLFKINFSRWLRSNKKFIVSTFKLLKPKVRLQKTVKLKVAGFFRCQTFFDKDVAWKILASWDQTFSLALSQTLGGVEDFSSFPSIPGVVYSQITLTKKIVKFDFRSSHVNMTVVARHFGKNFKQWKRNNWRRLSICFKDSYKFSPQFKFQNENNDFYCYGQWKENVQKHSWLAIEGAFRVIAIWDLPFVLSLLDPYILFWGDRMGWSAGVRRKRKLILLNFLTQWPYAKPYIPV